MCINIQSSKIFLTFSLEQYSVIVGMKWLLMLLLLQGLECVIPTIVNEIRDCMYNFKDI